MAFVNSVAKPPRDVRRRQEKFGTGGAAVPEKVRQDLCCCLGDRKWLILGVETSRVCSGVLTGSVLHLSAPECLGLLPG